MSNRESWLADFATAAKPHLTASLSGLGGNEEAVIRLSCGFTPKTGRKAADAAIVPHQPQTISSLRFSYHQSLTQLRQWQNWCCPS
jgi:hypothetical protein